MITMDTQDPVTREDRMATITDQARIAEAALRSIVNLNYQCGPNEGVLAPAIVEILAQARVELEKIGPNLLSHDLAYRERQREEAPVIH